MERMTTPSITEMALAALYGTYDETPLTNADFNAIVSKWELSNKFLTKYLGKSYDSIRNYRYRDKELPHSVSAMIRRLDRFLTCSAG